MIDFLLKNKELINVLSGLGAFISSIIAIYTLREVIKQRLSTYKPDLLLKSLIVYISKSPLELQGEELLKYRSANFNEYKKDSGDIQKDSQVVCTYKIENLGFGPAKKIKCTWEYNTTKALKILEDNLSNDYYFSQYKELDYFFLKTKQDTNFQFSITNTNKLIQTIDYLAPINVKEHSHLHTIPREIITTHFLYFIFKNKLFKYSEKVHFHHVFKELPRPSLKIEYEDINGKKYSRSFKFEITLVSTQLEEPMDMSKEFGYLLFKLT